MSDNFKHNPFYDTPAWRRVRRAYLAKACYICEECGQPAAHVHHIIHLNAGNINNPKITLSFSNLKALCQACHNREHFMHNPAVREGLYFDSEGQLREIAPHGNADRRI